MIKKSFGIGNTKVKNIFNYCGLNPRIRLKSVKKKHLNEIEILKSNFNTETTLKNLIKSYIEFIIDNKSYQGIKKHKLKYPIKGQKIHKNAKKTNRNKKAI